MRIRRFVHFVKNIKGSTAALFCICAAICVFAMYMIVESCTDRYLEEMQVSLETTLIAAQTSYETSANEAARLKYIEEGLLYFVVDYIAEIFSDGSLTNAHINEIQQIIPDVFIYLVRDDGRVARSPMAPIEDHAVELAQEALGKHVITSGDVLCAARRLNGGTILALTKSRGFELLTTALNHGSAEMDVIFWDVGTGEQIFASDPRVGGMSDAEFTGRSSPMRRYRTGYNDVIGHFSYLRKYIDDHTTVTAYSSAETLGVTIVRSVLAEMILLPTMIIGMFIFVISLPKSGSGAQLTRGLRISKSNFRYFTTFALICSIIAMGISVYIQLLSDYSRLNIRADDALSDLASMSARNAKNYERIGGVVDEYIDDVIRLFAYGINEKQGMMTSSRLKKYAADMRIYDIEIFDGNGIITASTNEAVGYELSSDPNSIDRAFWDVLEGREMIWHEYMTEDKSMALAGVSIGKGRGMIRVSYDNTLKTKIFSSLSTFDSAFRACDFGAAYKAYIDGATNTFKVMAPRSSRIDVYDISGEGPIPDSPFVGFRTVDGISYHVNTLPVDGKVLIYALPTSVLINSILDGIGLEAIALLAVYLVLVAASSVTFAHEDDALTSESDEVDHGIVDHQIQSRFRRTISQVVFISMVIALATFAIDGVWSRSSLFSYMMMSDSPAGVDLFTITKIILVILVVWSIGRMICYAVDSIFSKLGSRAITIGHMLCSVIKFGELFFLVAYSLVQFGVSLGSLLAGAGIAGAGIAIAGQSVVSDLLSGLFIVFEGKFGVGDWVTLGGWRGQILDIGVRTTSIAVGGCVKIVNNSQLGGIVVLDRSSSGVVTTFQIAYREDVERVLELLNSSTDKFVREAPTIVDGPLFQGVAELADSGVTLRVWALIKDQSTSGSTTRAILRVTKRILDENGISIPFPQIVIHKGDDDS